MGHDQGTSGNREQNQSLVKMKDHERELLTGKELSYAIDNNLPVFYTLTMHNPDDSHMNIRGKFFVVRTGDGNQLEVFKDRNHDDSRGYSAELWEQDESCSYLGDEAIEQFSKVAKVKYA